MFSILLGGTLDKIKLKRGQFYRKPSSPCFRGALRSSAPGSQDCPASTGSGVTASTGGKELLAVFLGLE